MKETRRKWELFSSMALLTTMLITMDLLKIFTEKPSPPMRLFKGPGDVKLKIKLKK
jgi:hypothetical protein